MFRPISGLAVVWMAVSLTAAELKIDFNDYKLNEAPKGFRSALTGSGQPGHWKIIEDEVPSPFQKITPNAQNFSKRGVLAQLSRDRTDSHYPLLVYEGEVFKDFTLTTRFKIVDGKEEQMAGVAFRIQDEKNYYYVRASALGNTFYFFKFINGDLIGPVGSKVAIAKGVWHEMTVECRGSQVTCSLDGKVIIPEMRQDNFMKGKIGLWTKSDAVSYFADLRLNYARVEPLAQSLVKETMKNQPRLLGLKIFAPAATNSSELRMVASSDETEIGQPAEKVEQDVLARGSVYYGKGLHSVLVTMPLHDRNGDRVAAARVVMRTFTGQTEQNAIVRASAVIRPLQARIQNAKDLTE
jgi:3-keto-disaccharide hydrolase